MNICLFASLTCKKGWKYGNKSYRLHEGIRDINKQVQSIAVKFHKKKNPTPEAFKKALSPVYEKAKGLISLVRDPNVSIEHLEVRDLFELIDYGQIELATELWARSDVKKKVNPAFELLGKKFEQYPKALKQLEDQYSKLAALSHIKAIIDSEQIDNVRGALETVEERIIDVNLQKAIGDALQVHGGESMRSWMLKNLHTALIKTDPKGHLEKFVETGKYTQEIRGVKVDIQAGQVSDDMISAEFGFTFGRKTEKVAIALKTLDGTLEAMGIDEIQYKISLPVVGSVEAGIELEDSTIKASVAIEGKGVKVASKASKGCCLGCCAKPSDIADKVPAGDASHPAATVDGTADVDAAGGQITVAGGEMQEVALG